MVINGSLTERRRIYQKIIFKNSLIMIIQILKTVPNTGQMHQTKGTFETYDEDGTLKTYTVSENFIDILKYRYIHRNISHPLKSGDALYYRRIHCLNYENKKVYFLNRFGAEKTNGIHIGLSWKENQKFLFLMGQHWLQQEDNIRFLTNMALIVFGIIMSGIK
jgi:hypothetical protein